MVVANLLDLAIDDLHHLGADALNDLAGALSGSQACFLESCRQSAQNLVLCFLQRRWNLLNGQRGVTRAGRKWNMGTTYSS